MRWFGPDGEEVPGVPDRAAGLAAGLLGVEGSFAEGWDLPAPEAVLPTRMAVEAVGEVVRAERKGIPGPASERLTHLRKRAWDTDREPTPWDACRRVADSIDRMLVAIAQSARREAAFEAALVPDPERMATLLRHAAPNLEDLHPVAHAWRKGPPPWTASSKSVVDPALLRAGCAASHARLSAAAAETRTLVGELWKAMYGIPEAEPAPEPAPPTPHALPGESPASAMERLVALHEAIYHDNRHAAPPDNRIPELRRAVEHASPAIRMLLSHVRYLEENLAAFACKAARVPDGDEKGLRSLANWHLAHECGSRALEIRYVLRKHMPMATETVREAVATHAPRPPSP